MPPPPPAIVLAFLLCVIAPRLAVAVQELEAGTVPVAGGDALQPGHQWRTQPLRELAAATGNLLDFRFSPLELMPPQQRAVVVEQERTKGGLSQWNVKNVAQNYRNRGVVAIMLLVVLHVVHGGGVVVVTWWTPLL